MGERLGFIGGFLGHVFVNDGQLADGTTFGLTDLQLPYAGERYCVQGHHGFISHWVHDRADQEYSYDWSMPEGMPILAAREGHITQFKESRTGNITAGNEHHVASHEGRCFSMRKYRSSNVDRGPCSLT